MKKTEQLISGPYDAGFDIQSLLARRLIILDMLDRGQVDATTCVELYRTTGRSDQVIKARGNDDPIESLATLWSKLPATNQE